MTHLDEGQLHAYLDGEPGDARPELERHLAACAECRTRLETERGLRERARAVLGAAGPASTVAPPFEQILRRARGRERGRRTPPAVILAWAASLALAVTAGWYARGLRFTPSAPPAAELARARTVEARPPAPMQVAEAPPAAPARNAPVADRAQPSSTVVAAAPPESAVGTLAGQPNVALAPAAAPAAKGVTAAETAAPAPEKQVARARMNVAAPAVLSPAGWTTVSRSAAEERLGGPIGIVPGLPLLGYAVSGTGPGTVVRTIQVLGTGVTIELYQRRAVTTAERVAAPAAGAGVASFTVDWEGYSVTGTAPVPRDSLRTLLAKLRAP